jgi:hypothetical protein
MTSIGVYNVHLVARAMGSAAPGEQRSTASALTSVRSLGTAFGAAIAGVVANSAGLGDAKEPEAVGHAVTMVYMFCWIPFGLAVAFMIRFVRVAFGTFSVSGWSGMRERLALWAGPLIALAGLVSLTLIALLPGLVMLAVSGFVMGIGHASDPDAGDRHHHAHDSRRHRWSGLLHLGLH